MGAIAEGITAYVQPLLNQTDGSTEQMSRAFALGQLCWNLALLPEEKREEFLGEMRPTLHLDDDEFEEFRRSVVIPMIRRHHEMFPQMSRMASMKASREAPAPPHLTTPARTQKYPGTGRNAPCPCNSGRKYKLCCGR
ncbi:MAG: SEC-C metal-binding domain-containing protein [Methylococcales bacterium]